MDKEKVIAQWQQFVPVTPIAIKEAINTQHHASQFIAMAGRHLIPQRDDDSNTSMVWDENVKGFASELIDAPQPFFLKLGIADLKLEVCRKDGSVISAFQLPQNSKTAALEWLKTEIGALGVGPEKLSDQMHYEIPGHIVQEGGLFPVHDDAVMLQATRERENANLILQAFARDFQHASDVRTWPHHFDTGAVIPVEFEAGEAVKALGIGYAVPDAMVDAPYFYVNLYSKQGINTPEQPEALPAGKWLMNGWKGAVLPLNEIYGLSGSKQAETALDFFSKAVEHGRNILMNTA